MTKKIRREKKYNNKNQEERDRDREITERRYKLAVNDLKKGKPFSYISRSTGFSHVILNTILEKEGIDYKENIEFTLRTMKVSNSYD